MFCLLAHLMNAKPVKTFCTQIPIYGTGNVKTIYPLYETLYYKHGICLQ